MSNGIIESQSLFYWKTPCNRKQFRLQGLPIKVTILVLLENSLQQKMNHSNDQMILCHNPCFIGKLLAMKYSRSRRGFRTEVTILVLLENSLQLNALIMLKNKLKCHNPCFIGKLLAMSVLRDQNKPNELSQSLFYWKTPCNFYARYLLLGLKSVTILVLLENSLQ